MNEHVIPVNEIDVCKDIILKDRAVIDKQQPKTKNKNQAIIAEYIDSVINRCNAKS